MEKTCKNCTRKIKRGTGFMCFALTDTNYPFEKYGFCWAWTDNPGIMQKISQEVEIYKENLKSAI
jgi:hypothetical protein